MMSKTRDPLLEATLEAQLHDPFSYLGLHREGEEWVLRIFLPYGHAPEALAMDGWVPLNLLHEHGIYTCRSSDPLPQPCAIRYRTRGSL